MKIALMGDIALFGCMSVNNNPHLYDYFSDIADYLSQFDYVVGNLETPFSKSKKTSGAKSAFICSDVENISILKQLHVNAVCLSNNHMFDFGREGYETTKRLLEDNDIDYFGTEGKGLRIEFEGNHLAFSGFCCYSSGPLKCVPLGDYGVNAYNIKTVEECLINNNKDGFLNIVAVHAGKEHVNYPAIEHIRAARLLAEKINYIYYGHHPHVIQGVEDYNGSLLAYSLGNFCFDDIYTKASGNNPLITLTDNNRHGMILELTIEKNKVIQWEERVICISKEQKMEILDNYEPLKDYNSAVINCELDKEAYNNKRNSILVARVNERKDARNLMWYFRRLRPMYLRLYFNSRKNVKNYCINVLNYINK